MRIVPALALSIAAVSGSIGSAAAVDKVTFQLGWLPTGDISAAYVGVQNGMFEAEGLDVTIRTGRGSLDAVSKIGTGVSDIGATGLGAVMQFAAEGPVPIKVIMSQYTKMPDALLTWKGSGITSIKDVVGRTVGTATFAGTTAYWPSFLQTHGIDPASVKLVKADVNALAGLLASGQVDATLNWMPTAPGMGRVLKEVGKELVVFPWFEIGYEGYGYVVVASDKTIRERPDVVRRFNAAFRKVLQAAMANPALVGAAVKAKVPEVDEATVTAEFAASAPLIKNEISERDGMGTLNPKLVQATWDMISKSLKYPPDKINPESLIDRSFLAAK
jgi:NitT/TauT family transport system substrate-binding protein